MKFTTSTKTMIGILFWVTAIASIILSIAEQTYSLKCLAFDIQSRMFLIAYFFYKEEQE